MNPGARERDKEIRRQVQRLEMEVTVYRRLYRGALEALKAQRRRSVSNPRLTPVS
jgi:hypothetical protein